MKCDAEVVSSFLAIVLFFYPTDNSKNQKLEKKKCLDALPFYTYVPSNKIIRCMVPHVWSVVDRILCHLISVFTLLLP